MLAQYMLWPGVCLSVTSRSLLKQLNGEAVFFGAEATLVLSYSLLKRNLGIFKNKGTSPWNIAPNSVFFAMVCQPSQVLSL